MKFAKLLLILILSTHIFAAKKTQKIPIEINFKNLKISDFIVTVAKILNKNILISTPVSGNIDFINNKTIYEEDILEILLSVLEVKGFTIVESGNMYKVVRTSLAARENLPILKTAKNRKLMMTTIIKLDQENIDLIVSRIRNYISNSARLISLRENNTMILSDYPANIKTVKAITEALIKNIDKIVIDFVKLDHALVDSVFPYLSTVISNLINQKIASNKTTILKDNKSNKIIIMGKRTNIDLLKKVIKELDIPEPKKQAAPTKNVKIIPLNHADAKLLAATITNISKSLPAVQKIQPIINFEESLNALIVIAVPEQIKQLEQIILELDKPKKQIYVKATILEVQESNLEDIGLELGFNAIGGLAGTKTSSGKISGAGIITLGTKLSGAAPKVTANGNTGFALNLGLAFLETYGASKVISEPSILAVNNKNSSLYVGQTQSIQTGTVSSATTGTTTNYKRIDIGLTLDIKPRITGDNKVSLVIAATAEGISGKDSSGQPLTTKRRVKTEAVVNNEESIVIGGLSKQDETANRKALPKLSEIPLIGPMLFRKNDSTNSRTDLVIIITPYIVNSSSDFPKLIERLNELEIMQDKYNSEVLTIIKNNQSFKQFKARKAKPKARIYTGNDR